MAEGENENENSLNIFEAKQQASFQIPQSNF